MKKLSIILGIVILVGGFSFAHPVISVALNHSSLSVVEMYQSGPAQAKTDKKPVAAADKTPKKTETKKEVKKVPVRKPVVKKDNSAPSK